MAAPPQLAAFCRAEQRRLVGLLDLYLGDLGTAEELAQEALLRACERWERVQGHADPGAWVRTVAMNLARSHWRRRGAERRARRHQESLARVPELPPDPDDALAVRAALQRLPERQRRVLVLRYYGGLSHAEVAAAVGGTEGGARVAAHRAVAALREELGAEWGVAFEEVGP